MNEVLKLYLSMSFSGGLLILALFLGKLLLQDRISRQWQYYIWMIVILRLLLPFGPEMNLLGKIYQAADQAMSQTAVSRQPQSAFHEAGGALTAGDDQEWNTEPMNDSVEGPMAGWLLQDVRELLSNHIWLIWLVTALGLVIRKVTIYQGFIRYIHAGLMPVSDVAMLDRLSVAAKWAGMKKPVELCINPLISSPLLIGFFHPCIVLPDADISEKDFQYTIVHELTHYKRRDMLYKWLAQVTVCLHWFNPLVHLMNREMMKACEFSCDEAVVVKTGCANAKEYGQTLLDAMWAVGRYQEKLGALTLNENKQLLKERLRAIMRYKKPSKAVTFLTVLLTLCVAFGAVFLGVYQMGNGAGNVYAAGLHDSTPVDTADKPSYQPHLSLNSSAAEYYENNSLPQFSAIFSRLCEEEQNQWLERIYTDGQIAFWGAVVGQMDEDVLEEWLDKALEDGNIQFQSVLFNALDREDEFEEKQEKQEKEWAEAQRAEYQAAGVTMDGKNCYYQGQLVNIFLDVRSTNQSFYTLNMNPKGTVNIRIIRGEDEKITGVAYLTEAEITELFGNWDEPDEAAE